MITIYNNTNEQRVGERLAHVPTSACSAPNTLISTAPPAGWCDDCTHFTGGEGEVLRGRSHLSKTVLAGRWQS